MGSRATFNQNSKRQDWFALRIQKSFTRSGSTSGVILRRAFVAAARIFGSLSGSSRHWSRPGTSGRLMVGRFAAGLVLSRENTFPISSRATQRNCAGLVRLVATLKSIGKPARPRRSTVTHARCAGRSGSLSIKRSNSAETCVDVGARILNPSIAQIVWYSRL